ncbi:MAG: FAD-binding protein [Elusimicrobia bacterium]|nr:FAD-binding protein [Elusimicrobiota bacterium]
MKPAYNKATPRIIGELRRIAGDAHVLTSDQDRRLYGGDSTEHLVFPPEVAVKPRTAEEISRILKLADEARIPVTPRGGGTGLSGGALPVFGGIALSVERMNQILEIDRENLMAVIEPGVITEILQNEVEKAGLYYPPDPASRGSCQLGGNVAENAGGPHALKYGVTKDYVLGLEAVLPSGEIIKTGGKLLKDVTGYNLTQLLVGSEGTLAIVTKIILKLIPLPQYRRLLYAPFPALDDAAVALTKIFARRIMPAACEFMEKSSMEIVEKRLSRQFPSRGSAQACLLVELDGNDQALLERESEIVGEILAEYNALDVLTCDSAEKQKEIWNLRRSIGEAVKQLIYKEEDTVVPRTRLPELVGLVKDISKRHGLESVCYGHAGDGNIHVNLLRGELDEGAWKLKSASAIREIFTETVRLGGNISGEHGIGWIQKEYLPMGLGPVEIKLMRRIKTLFDPNNILNPGKIFPESAV